MNRDLIVIGLMTAVASIILVQMIGAVSGLFSAYEAGILTSSVYISGAAYHLFLSESDNIPPIVAPTFAVVGFAASLTVLLARYQPSMFDVFTIGYAGLSFYGSIYWAWWYGRVGDEWPDAVRPYAKRFGLTRPPNEN